MSNTTKPLSNTLHAALEAFALLNEAIPTATLEARQDQLARLAEFALANAPKPPIS